MKEFWNVIQLAFAAVGGWLGWFLGGCDGLLYALLAFVVLDYITGLMCGIVDKKLSSEVRPYLGQIVLALDWGAGTEPGAHLGQRVVEHGACIDRCETAALHVPVRVRKL